MQTHQRTVSRTDRQTDRPKGHKYHFTSKDKWIERWKGCLLLAGNSRERKRERNGKTDGKETGWRVVGEECVWVCVRVCMCRGLG